MSELEKAVEDLCHEFGVSAKTKLKDHYLPLTDFKQAILALIQDEVRKARIDELFYLTNHCDPLVMDRVYVQNRIKQLSEGKE